MHFTTIHHELVRAGVSCKKQCLLCALHSQRRRSWAANWFFFVSNGASAFCITRFSTRIRQSANDGPCVVLPRLPWFASHLSLFSSSSSLVIHHRHCRRRHHCLTQGSAFPTLRIFLVGLECICSLSPTLQALQDDKMSLQHQCRTESSDVPS